MEINNNGSDGLVNPISDCLIDNSFIFQHGNDPKHTTNVVKAFLNRKIHNGTLSVMNWPPQSQDLNLFEEVWNHLDREQKKSQSTPKEEL